MGASAVLYSFLFIIPVYLQVSTDLEIGSYSFVIE
jgi:hypothetical protein